MKKVIALMLIVASIAGIIASCANKKLPGDEILKTAANNLVNEYKPDFAEDIEKAAKEGYVTFDMKVSNDPVAFVVSGEYSSAGDIALGMTGLDKKYGINLKTAKDDLKTSAFRAYDESLFGIDKDTEDKISSVLDSVKKVFEKKGEFDFKPYIKDIKYNASYASQALLKCDVIHLSVTKKEFLDLADKMLKEVEDMFKGMAVTENIDIDESLKDINDEEILLEADVVTDTKTHDLLYAEIRAYNTEKHGTNKVASVTVTTLREGAKKYVCTVNGQFLDGGKDMTITVNTVKSDKEFDVNVSVRNGETRVLHAELKIDKEAKTIKLTTIGEDSEDINEFSAKYDVKKENTYTEVSVEFDIDEETKITVNVGFHKNAYKADYVNLLKESDENIAKIIENLSNALKDFSTR